MTAERSFYGAVGAGGTKFVCAIGDGLGNIHVEERFSTTDPTSTPAIGLARLGPCNPAMDAASESA